MAKYIFNFFKGVFMPTRMKAQTQPVTRPPRMGATATRYAAGAPVPRQPVAQAKRIPVQPISRQTKINAALKGQKPPKPPKPKQPRGLSVQGFIIQKLLECKWTYKDITQAIAMKFDAQTAEVWKNRIAIERCDINAGRIARRQVEELRIRLPIPRFEREGNQLFMVQPKPRQASKQKTTVQAKPIAQRPNAPSPIRKAIPVTRTAPVQKILAPKKAAAPIA
jgi:hypothetical protein